MKQREKERLCERLEMEVGKILDKYEKSEMTTNALDSLFKIIDIMNKLENEKYWDVKCEYYYAVLDEMQAGGYSERGYSREGGGSSYRENRGGRGYSREGGNDGGYSRDSSYANRGQHWVRGHYSRDDGRRDPYMDYMDGKQSYRNSGKTEECKHRMLGALQERLEDLTQEINEIGQDADCVEEREMLKRYVQKLQSMM